MNITTFKAKELLDNGDKVWFFINVYSSMTESVYINVKPQELGQLHFPREGNSPVAISPMGKQGTPLKKRYNAVSRTDNKCDVRYFSDFNNCVKAYNKNIEEFRLEIDRVRIRNNELMLSKIEKVKSMKVDLKGN